MFDFGADSRNEGGEARQNHKGLVTLDRKYKKDAFYAYKAWLSNDPFVHICGKRYINRVEDTTRVTVYSNLPTVELFVNGKSVGKKTCEEHFFYFEVPNIGKSKLVAIAGNEKDESYICKVDKFDESYRLVEKGAIINWFDITQIDGYYSLNDKIADVIISNEAKVLFEKLIDFLAEKTDEETGNMLKAFKNALDSIGSFKIIRLVNMVNSSITKEELLEFNKEFNKIKKL